MHRYGRSELTVENFKRVWEAVRSLSPLPAYRGIVPIERVREAARVSQETLREVLEELEAHDVVDLMIAQDRTAAEKKHTDGWYVPGRGFITYVGARQ